MSIGGLTSEPLGSEAAKGGLLPPWLVFMKYRS